MQIAIPRVKYVDRRDSDRISFVINQLQQFSERTLGNHRVLHNHVGAQLSHEAPRHFACLPEFLSLVFVIAEIDFHRARIFQQVRHGLHACIHQHGRPFDLSHQQKRVRGQTDGHRTVLNHGHKSRIHQFNGDRKRWMHNQTMDCFFCGMQIGECCSKRPRFFGTR